MAEPEAKPNGAVDPEIQLMDSYMEADYQRNRHYYFEDSDSESDQPSTDKKGKYKTLCLKNVPRELTDNGIRNLCNPYGKTGSIRRPSENLAFIDFMSRGEIESARRGINATPHLNIRAEYARERKNNANEILSITALSLRENALTIERKRNGDSSREEPRHQSFNEQVEQTAVGSDDGPDMSKRYLKGPFSVPNRILSYKFPKIIDESDYQNEDLRTADPRKEFMVDTHIVNKVPYEFGNKRVLNGRVIFKENHQIKERIQNLSKSSKGSYNQVTSEFVHSSSELSYLMNFVKICTKCKAFSNKKCTKCDQSYCSISCLESDKSHPDICGNKIFEIKESNEELKNEFVTSNVIEIPAEPITRKSLVNIVYVLNQRTVFVRPLKEKMKYVQFLNDVIKSSKQAKCLQKLPKVGTLVLARLDGIYNRALVLRVTGDNDIRVAYIDVGNVEQVNLAQLKEMPRQLTEQKRFVTKVVLENIPELGITDEPLAYLNEIMLKEIDVIIEFTGEYYDPVEMKCTLIDEESTQSINANLMFLDDPAKIKSEQDEIGDALDGKNPQGKNVPVIILNITYLILPEPEVDFILADDLEEFQRNDEIIHNTAEIIYPDDDLYTPCLGQLCLVKVPEEDGRWYRAECVERDYDGYITVTLCDYGNMLMVHIRNIRKMLSQLLFPCLTVRCRFAGYSSPSDEEREQLKSVLPILSEIIFSEITLEKNAYDNKKDIVVKLSDGLVTT